MLLCRLSGFNFSCNDTLEEFELNLIAFRFLSMRPNAGWLLVCYCFAGIVISANVLISRINFF